MLDNEWHDDPITTAVWVYCLLRANYETARWHGIIIQPGQFVTSLSTMAKDVGITVSQLRTALNHLKMTRQLTRQVASSATLITIENWATYQSAGEKVTRSLASSLTIESQTDDKRLATNKEIKKEKEIKNEREIKERADVIPSCDAFAGVALSTEHDMFAPIKARIAMEAAQSIKEREEKQ
jgi:hypothetical protein